MDPTPALNAAHQHIPSTDVSGAAWTAAGATGSALTGLYAAVSMVPGSLLVTLCGALGSILVPLYKLRCDAEKVALKAEVKGLRERLAAAESERDLFRDRALAAAGPREGRPTCGA